MGDAGRVFCVAAIAFDCLKFYCLYFAVGSERTLVPDGCDTGLRSAVGCRRCSNSMLAVTCCLLFAVGSERTLVPDGCDAGLRTAMECRHCLNSLWLRVVVHEPHTHDKLGSSLTESLSAVALLTMLEVV